MLVRWAPRSDVVVPLPDRCGLPEQTKSILQFRGPSFGTAGWSQNWDLGFKHIKKEEPFCGPETGPQFRDQVLTKSGQQFGPTAAPWSAYRAPSAAHGRGGPRSVHPQRRRQRHAHIRARPSCAAPCGRNTCARGSATRCSSAASSTMLVVGATLSAAGPGS